MKKILLFFVGLATIITPRLVVGQSFTVPHDTIAIAVNNGGGTQTPQDAITNITATGGLTLHWHVLSTNFPSDWLQAGVFGICDNKTCYYNTDDTNLWDIATSSTGNTQTTLPYVYETAGNFNLALSLPTTATAGCYYVTVAITDPATFYTKNVTFSVCNTVTAVPNVINSNDDVLLYPNPTSNDLNVVYSANADVKSVAIYNIIGKVMTTYRVAGNSANLNLDNVPSGIYFVRLINSHGDPVATRKFTKQ